MSFAPDEVIIEGKPLFDQGISERARPGFPLLLDFPRVLDNQLVLGYIAFVVGNNTVIPASFFQGIAAGGYALKIFGFLA